MSLVRMENLTKSYGANLILDSINWQIAADDRVGLIGNNGSGKTTLFKIAVGEIKEFKGICECAKRARIGYLKQEPDFASDLKLRDAIRESAFEHIQEMERQMEELTQRMSEVEDDDEQAEVLDQYARVQEKYEAHGGYDYEHRIDSVLAGMGFRNADFSLPVRVLSGGQKGRAAIAKLLLEEPDLLLLDEPTNHLDLEATEWLEEFIKTEYRGAVIVVSHDRYFLDRVVTKITELHNNKLKEYRGNYTKYMFLKERQLLVQQREYSQQQEEIDHNLDFVRRYHAGQRSKEARGRMKMLDRMELIDKPQGDDKKIKLNFTTEVRGGDDVLQLRSVSKTYDGKTLFRDLTMDLYRKDRLGIIGPNGVGKTTLLRMIMNQEKPSTGTVRLGYNLKLGYYDQQLSGLNTGNTVLDELWQLIPKGNPGEVRSYLGRFLFSGDDVFKRIGDLSGGEQSRVAIAKLLLENANFLILDEPTNHLDISSKEVLEDALSEFPATMIIVSHDRYFLDRVVNKILFIERDKVHLWVGNYTDYQEHLLEKKAEEIAKATEERRRIATEKKKAEIEAKKQENLTEKDKKKKKKKSPPKGWIGV
ncbi:MAG: ABC-F family ATP-binding cassette domain-containing protein [Candidatus Poribacteria bacterium]